MASSYLNLENTRMRAAELLADRKPEEVAERCRIRFDAHRQHSKLGECQATIGALKRILSAGFCSIFPNRCAH